MSGYGHMAGVAARPLLFSLLTISTLFGCGQLPQGQVKMTGYGGMAGVAPPSLLVSLLTISTFGCGKLPQGQVLAMPENCIIVGGTVTATCNLMMAGATCNTEQANAMRIQAVPAQHLTISGSLRIANPIMAGWSREMWQSVLNRVARNLASGPFGVNFRSASVTVG